MSGGFFAFKECNSTNHEATKIFVIKFKVVSPVVLVIAIMTTADRLGAQVRIAISETT